MNVRVFLVRMVEHVMMRLTVTHVNVWMDSLVYIVKQVKIAYFYDIFEMMIIICTILIVIVNG